MNVIAEGGAIQITFPSQYTQSFPNPCRVIRGLVDGTLPINCDVSNGRNIKITRFAQFEP